ncbi:MAG: alginate export family protein [Candidatus Electryonea clarkiae]|nr:alginate export family protein [Candidatus Electryonea clarkiae]MDP8288162.1 alginate export family protein [Candidatus Electryonea clarkiae]
MHRIIYFSTLLFVILAGHNIAYASLPIGEHVTIDGNMRYRIEVDGKDFDNNTGLNENSLLRSQVGFRVQASKSVNVRMKFKDSRFLGTTGSNSKSTSFIDLQEGYILVNNPAGMPFDLQVGRYEMMYGRRRIQGNGNWNNFGPRTFDGGRLFFNICSIKIDMFYAKLIERGFFEQPAYTKDFYTNGDRILLGTAGKMLDGMIQPLFTVNWDPVVENLQGINYDNADFIMTPAVYSRYDIQKLSLELDAAYQYGKKNDRDLSAWLFAFDAGFSPGYQLNPIIGAGVDITSGNKFDEDGKDYADHVFYTPYMSRHAFRGFMDYFKDVRRGLIDSIMRIGLSPHKSTEIDVDFHNFRYFQDERYPGSSQSFTGLGQELDFRIRIELADGLKMDAVLCAFSAEKNWQPVNDIGLFGYAALTASF